MTVLRDMRQMTKRQERLAKARMTPDPFGATGLSRQALYQITAPHMCAGLVTRDGVVTQAVAPILAWTIGKQISEVHRWCASKGYKIVHVPQRQQV
jgi:hypothetical protein